MFAPLSSSILTAALLVGGPPVDGMQISFQGSVAPLDESRNPRDAEKTFDLLLVLADVGDSGATMYWTIDERGRGAWPWAERFGRVRLDARLGTDSADGPSLLYDHGETTSIIPLGAPFLIPPEPLAAGVTWQQGRSNYAVEERTELEGRDVWRIELVNQYGRNQTLWSDAEHFPLMAGYDQRVFMGRGDEYLLRLRLVGAEELSTADFEHMRDGLDALVALRHALNRPRRTESADWTAAQLATLEEQAPQIEQQVAAAPLLPIVRAAVRDLKLQSSRASDVAELVAQFHRHEVQAFEIDGLGRAALNSEDLRGKVTVLHFWEYRDSPLKEPYGQVGYLDFLYAKRKPEGLAVFGVAVDGRLTDENTRGAAVRSVRKLAQFMNLAYPVLLDGGALVKQFGDPRLIGATLPLFVVIDARGRVAHYHVGYYDVDRDQGLKELDGIVGELLSGGS